VLPNEVFDLLREVVVHRHTPTSHAPIAPATPPLNGYAKLRKLEAEIAKDLSELEAML